MFSMTELRDARNILAVDQDTPAVQVVLALEQGQQGGLAAAGLADQTDALAALEVQREVAENLIPVGILKRYLVKNNAGATPDQWPRLGVISQLVRNEQRCKGLRKPRDVLCHIDESDRQIPRGMQDGQSERAGEHDIPGRCRAALPKQDGPGRKSDCQQNSDQGMQYSQSLQIQQAAPPGGHFAIDDRIEPAVLAADAAERVDDRQVADDVHHLAVNSGSLVGKVMMQGPSRDGHPEHCKDHDTGNDRQSGRHRNADRRCERDGRDRCDARRQYIPDKHILDGIDGVGRGRDAACQCPGHTIGEITLRMAGQMAKKVTTQVAGYAHKRGAGDPACQPPQQIVGGDQGDQNEKSKPHARGAAGAGQRIN
jgi:hypothetical protein